MGTPQPTLPATCREEVPEAPSEAGPGSTCRVLEWVGCGTGDYRVLGTAAGTVLTTHSSPSGASGARSAVRTSECRLSANKGEI